MAAALKPDAPATPVVENPTDQSGGKGSLLPVLLVVGLVPVLCYVVTSFVLLPKLKSEIIAEVGDGGRLGGGGKSGQSERKANKGGESSVEFGSTVVNLAGAMGQRYLRTNFVVAGSDAKIADIIKTNQSALRDVTINVLSAQSLAALESPGAKNLVRNELITQFNRVLGGEVVEQLYFSEFVVQ